MTPLSLSPSPPRFKGKLWVVGGGGGDEAYLQPAAQPLDALPELLDLLVSLLLFSLQPALALLVPLQVSSQLLHLLLQGLLAAPGPLDRLLRRLQLLVQLLQPQLSRKARGTRT